MTPMTPHILLAEDNPADIELLKIAFEDAGTAVVIDNVSNGREAKNRLLQMATPDLQLIVLDLNLPSISGLDLLDLIKHDPKWIGVPTVMLTSSNRQQDRDRAFALNVDAYLVKPGDFSGYKSIVAELIACMERGPRASPALAT